MRTRQGVHVREYANPTTWSAPKGPDLLFLAGTPGLGSIAVLRMRVWVALAKPTLPACRGKFSRVSIVLDQERMARRAI